MRRGRADGPDPAGGGGTVHAITGVRRGLSEDVGARQRRYLISMAIRTVCFLLAILSSGWLRWAFVAGSLVLPYISVVMANGGREQGGGMPQATRYDARRALEGPRPERDATR